MAVRLRLANPGAEPWTVAGAVLKDSTGADVELSAWQASAIAPGAFGFVVVGAEGEPGQLACPCSLKLWEAQGPRTVTLGNITFPVRSKPLPASSAATPAAREKRNLPDGLPAPHQTRRLDLAVSRSL